MAYQPELEKLERRYQEDPGRNFAQLAESYRKLGRLDDALDVLRAHLTDRPNYVSGLVVLGRCLLDQQNDTEARETFERVLAVDSEHIIALKALGEIAGRSGQAGVARDWYQRLLDIDPMNDDAAAALSRLSSDAVVAGPDAAAPIEPMAPTPEPAETAPTAWAEHEVEAPAPPAPDIAPAAWAEPLAVAPSPPPAEIAPAAWAPAAPWSAPDQPGRPALAAEIEREEFTPSEDLEVRTAEFAGDMTIERASSEYAVEPAELEPLPVERINEADMPVEPPVEEATLEDELLGAVVRDAIAEPLGTDATAAAEVREAAPESATGETEPVGGGVKPLPPSRPRAPRRRTPRCGSSRSRRPSPSRSTWRRVGRRLMSS